MKIDPRWKLQPWHEIFQEDCYRLKRLNFTPRTVYDIGGNLGCFVGYAKSLWPNCRVVTVEPHPINIATLIEIVGGLPGVTALHAAMARGPARWMPAIGGESNPGGHTYVGECVGYESTDLETMPMAGCPSLTMAEIFAQYPPEGDYVVKLDCEGGEECLFDDEASNAVLRGARYFTAELHFFAAKHREIPECDRLKPGLMGTHGHVIRAFLDWIYGFADTHRTEVELNPNSGMLWCSKR